MGTASHAKGMANALTILAVLRAAGEAGVAKAE